MSLNSGLTSDTAPSLRIGFGNILDDSSRGKGVALQADRVRGIAREFINLGNGRCLDIAGLCEGASAENLEAIALQSGLNLVGEPIQYSPREWMAFGVGESMPIDEPPEFLRYGKEKDGFSTGLFIMKAAGVNFAMVHHRHNIFSARRDRMDGARVLIDSFDLTEPTVIIGDFNELPFQPSRSALLDHGFKEIFADDRPVYPNPGFRGKTYPRFLPSVSLDAAFISPHFKMKSKEAAVSDVSDHPLLYLELEVIKSQLIPDLATLHRGGSE